MKQMCLVFIILILLTPSILLALPGDEQSKFQLNMIRYSKVIVGGQVTEISETKDSYYSVYVVVNILVKEKVAGEAIKSNIKIMYPRSMISDVFWCKPKFKVGPTPLACLRKSAYRYRARSPPCPIFKIYEDKVEK